MSSKRSRTKKERKRCRLQIESIAAELEEDPSVCGEVKWVRQTKSRRYGEIRRSIVFVQIDSGRIMDLTVFDNPPKIFKG